VTYTLSEASIPTLISLSPLLFSGRIFDWDIKYLSDVITPGSFRVSFPPLFSNPHFSFPLFWPIGINSHKNWRIDHDINGIPLFLSPFCSADRKNLSRKYRYLTLGVSFPSLISLSHSFRFLYHLSFLCSSFIFRTSFSLLISFLSPFFANQKKWPQELTET